MDFHRGARTQVCGRAILAVASTAKGGKPSRTFPSLAWDTAISVARANVDIVVTEHGVARLTELSSAKRAEALIAIADPRHRDWLREGV